MTKDEHIVELQEENKALKSKLTRAKKFLKEVQSYIENLDDEADALYI